MSTNNIYTILSEERPLIIAKYGYSAIFPENTNISLEAAIQNNADIIHIPVQMSSDGYLVVVTFHSTEDRIVKRFIQARTGKLYSRSRYMPDSGVPPIQFNRITQKAVKPAASEISKNSRARSAKLRVARRTNFKPGKNLTLDELSVPIVGAN